MILRHDDNLRGADDFIAEIARKAARARWAKKKA
jgi:hypothetical protein